LSKIQASGVCWENLKKQILVRLRTRWKDNTKMGLKEIDGSLWNRFVWLGIVQGCFGTW
jgi:hypothetical protein